MGWVIIGIYAVVLLSLLVSVLQMIFGDAVTVKQTDHEKQLMWYFDTFEEAFVSVDHLVARGIVAAEAVDRMKAALPDPVGFHSGGRCAPGFGLPPAVASGGPVMVDNKGRETPIEEIPVLSRLYYGD